MSGDSMDVLSRELDAVSSVMEEPAAPGWPWAIPEAISDEDGENYYLQGHVAPALALLAVIVNDMENFDAEHAERALLGPEFTALDEPRRRRTWEERLAHASNVMQSVDHFYCKPDPDNDEWALPADSDDPLAEAWTVVRLGR